MVQSLEGIISGLIVYLRHGLDSISVSPEIVSNEWLAIAIGCLRTNGAFGESVVMGIKCPPRYLKATRQSDNESAVYSKVQKLSKSCCWKLGTPIFAMISGDRHQSVSLITRI